jgi:peptidoglycan/LPS O-acetylase OafA/YrhL
MSDISQGASKKERLLFIDKASGIAILLVVYGHIFFPETIATDWYIHSHKFIYKFHMPLFMCLSGYLVFMSTSSKSITTKSEYLTFQKKKLYKFVPVYIIASAASILLDALYKHLPVAEIGRSVFNSIFDPVHSSAVFVWYIYVLIGFYLVTPFLIRLKGPILYLLLLFGFLLTNVSFSQLFCADLFAKYFFFFLGGGLIYFNKEPFLSFLKQHGKLITVLTLGIMVVDNLIGLIIPYQLVSIGAIISVLYISNLEWPAPISKMFVAMGISSFAIYILNGPVLDFFYLIYKSILKMPIDGAFVFLSLIIALVLSITIRFIFNKVVPQKVYSL